jgi:hypothetical protein
MVCNWLLLYAAGHVPHRNYVQLLLHIPRTSSCLVGSHAHETLQPSPRYFACNELDAGLDSRHEQW